MRVVSAFVRLAFIALAIPVSAPGAQTGQPARPRVRVVVTESVDDLGRPAGAITELTGTLVSSTRDSLIMSVDGRQQPTTIPVSHVAALYESDGFHRHVGSGALVGLGAGLLIGGVGGYSTGIRTCADGNTCGPHTPESNEERVVAALLSGGILGAIGAGLGAILGSGSHEHWQLSSEARLRGAIVPTPNGVGMSLSLRW